MTHYGIAGFGTAAYAEALGKTEDAEKLKGATKKIYVATNI